MHETRKIFHFPCKINHAANDKHIQIDSKPEKESVRSDKGLMTANLIFSVNFTVAAEWMMMDTL